MPRFKGEVNRTLSTTALARALKMQRRSLYRWIKAGCPGEKDDKGEWRFDLAEVQAWQEEKGFTGAPGQPVTPDKEASQARKEAALADKHELQVAKLRGELVAREDAEAAVLGVIEQARSGFLGMPAKLSDRCAGMTAGEIFEEATELVTDILNGLAGGKWLADA